jgi:hypothetical protein
MKATPKKSTWKLAPKQQALFWRVWSAVMKWQGWNCLSAAEREAKRRKVLAELGFKSATQIGKTADLDRVLARFGELSGRVANEPEDAGQRRRYMSVIGNLLQDLQEADYPKEAHDRIMRERFHVIEGTRTIADLPTSELVNVIKTLRSRLAAHLARHQGIDNAASVQPVCGGHADEPATEFSNTDCEPLPRSLFAE